jgi:glycosyltransferase involved in cell wall biosynthesis
MDPLVSILIPAYRPRFFAAALASARAQSYSALEIVVGDDSPGDEIAREVEKASDARIRYERHAPALGFAGNFTRAWQLARGEYVKFLNDDDLLAPDCVARLVAALRAHPQASLATSRRTVIDADGKPLPDEAATAPLAPRDRIMDGMGLGRFLVLTSINRIGEPSTVLIRKSALELEGESLFRWGENDYECLADLSMWLRLLAKGPACWIAEPLSSYRYHGEQQQRSPGTYVRCVIERWLLVEDSARAGFLDRPEDYDTAARIAAGTFRHWLAQADEPPEFHAALGEFLPRIPARYLEPHPGTASAGHFTE